MLQYGFIDKENTTFTLAIVDKFRDHDAEKWDVLMPVDLYVIHHIAFHFKTNGITVITAIRSKSWNHFQIWSSLKCLSAKIGRIGMCSRVGGRTPQKLAMKV